MPENLAAWAQLFGVISVVISIVGLIVTIRQQTKFQKAMVVDSLATAIVSINIPCTESPALGLALSRAVTDWSSATRDERVMAHYFLFSFFRLLENAWYQQRSGVLDQAQWVGWETLMRKYFHSDGVQKVWWPNRRHTYSPEFQRYLATTTPPTNLAGLHEIFDAEMPAARRA
jgi:hypothetical protein